jgi:hypothetical protein
MYFGMTAYTTGPLMTLATSRLLLNMGSSCVTSLSEDLPRYDVPPALCSQRAPSNEAARCHFLSRMRRDVRKAESSASMSRFSSRASTLFSDEMRIRVQETHIQKRAWWMLGAKYGGQEVETHVILDRLEDVEGVHASTQTMKLSRLGQLDSRL